MATQCINEAEGLKCLDYEQGWMSPEEAEAFERDHLSKCQFCVDGLNIMTMALTISRDHPEFFNAWNKPTERRSIWQFSTARSFVAAAAVFVLMVSAGVVSFRHFKNQPEKDPCAALATFVLPSYEMDTIRSGGSADALFHSGMKAFEQQQWKKAIEKLQAAVNQEPTNPTFAYYNGLALTQVGHYEEAVKPLLITCEQGEDSLQANGRWYLANVYLKLHRRSDARNLFQTLATSKNRRQSDAQSILDRMNQLANTK